MRDKLFFHSKPFPRELLVFATGTVRMICKEHPRFSSKAINLKIHTREGGMGGILVPALIQLSELIPLRRWLSKWNFWRIANEIPPFSTAKHDWWWFNDGIIGRNPSENGEKCCCGIKALNVSPSHLHLIAFHLWWFSLPQTYFASLTHLVMACIRISSHYRFANMKINLYKKHKPDSRRPPPPKLIHKQTT